MTCRTSTTQSQVSREDPTAVVGTKLRRLFVERGIDFFDAEKSYKSSTTTDTRDDAEPADISTPSGEPSPPETSHPMTPDELYKMRMSLLPQL